MVWEAAQEGKANGRILSWRRRREKERFERGGRLPFGDGYRAEAGGADRSLCEEGGEPRRRGGGAVSRRPSH